MPNAGSVITKAWFQTRKQIEVSQLLVYTQQQVPAFSEQCFLLEKAGELERGIEKKQIIVSPPGSTKGRKKVPVRQLGLKYPSDKNISSNNVQRQRSNLTYIQKLTRLKRQNFFKYFSFTPSEIAQMAHKISVSEVLVDQNDPSSVISQPIMNRLENQKDFNSGADLLKPNVKRLGAGIESIGVNFVGIDSFTKKQVVLNGKFFFQDIKQMMSSPYAGLFTLETSRETNNRKYFRSIDFFIGWNSNAKGIQSAVDQLNLRIRCHLVKYSFDVRQDGSIVVDATYRGYYVDSFSGPGANILELAKTRFQQLKQRQEEIATRAKRIRGNNAQRVRENQKDKFLLDQLEKAVQRYFSTMSRPADKVSFGTPALAGRLYDDIFDSVYKKVGTGTATVGDGSEYATFIAAELINPTSPLRTVIPGLGGTTTGSLQEKKAVVDFLTSTAIPFADNVFNVRIQKPNFVSGTPVKTAANLRDEMLAAIQDKSKIINNNLQTANAGFAQSQKTAFDEQIRIANVARLQALQEIAKNLVKKEDIKYAVVDRQVVRNFKLSAASGSPNGVAAALDSVKNVASYIFDQKKVKGRINSTQFHREEKQVIPFVFLGHLLENLLNTPALYKPDKSGVFKPSTKDTVYKLMQKLGSDIRIDLGYLSYNAPFTRRRIRQLKLYYLPISLTELNNFFSREVVSKARSFYSFNDFINDLLKRMLSGIFAGCAKESNTKNFAAPRIDVMIGDLPEKSKNATQFFIHGSKDTINDLTKVGINKRTFGKYNSNISANIPHFFVFGKSTGIEKNIKLVDIADDQLKTAVYYSPRSSLVNEINEETSMRHTGFIPAVFQADIETVGFPLMNIGQLIYVDLKPTISKQQAKTRPFDASGYYRVYKVSHTANKDTFSTTISAIIQISDKDKKFLDGGLGSRSGTTIGGQAGTVAAGVVGSVSSAWSRATGAAAAAPSAPSATTPTPGGKSIATVFSPVPEDLGRANAWIKGVGIGAGNGFQSAKFKKYTSAHPEVSFALEQFISIERPTEAPRVGVVISIGITLRELFSGLSPKPIPDNVVDGKPLRTASDDKFVNELAKILKASGFSAGSGLKIGDAIDTAIKDGTLEEINDLKAAAPGYLILREFDDGEVEVMFVSIT